MGWTCSEHVNEHVNEPVENIVVVAVELFKGVLGMFHLCFRCFGDASWMFQGCFMDASRIQIPFLFLVEVSIASSSWAGFEWMV